MRNPQSLKGARKRKRALKIKARKAIPSEKKKVAVDGIDFDSVTQAAYYQYLKRDLTVLEIEPQPEFKIIEPYTVMCRRCGGTGNRTSPKTGNLFNCTLCHGKSKREKSSAVYTADFKVTYIDGFQEIIDLKGGSTTMGVPVKDSIIRKKTEWNLPL